MTRHAMLRAAAHMPPPRARMVLRALCAADAPAPGEAAPSADAAAAAFEADMRPVCEAIVSALEAGDVEALRGLRAMLPHLLAEVNAAPALADVLAHLLGRAFLTGLATGPREEVPA